MPCPFPGMDPFIERPAIWHDFQYSLVLSIGGALQSALRPKYIAMTKRLLCHEEDLFQLEARIVDPVADLRLITAIEVVNPQNKIPGRDRVAYLAKRDEYTAAGVNVVEIDLLREGQRVIEKSSLLPSTMEKSHYVVAVYRPHAARNLYVFPIQQSLPVLAVPMSDGESVTLDLQAAFARVWDEGPYPEMLNYHRPPPGDMSEAEQRWCRERLSDAGFGKSS